MLAIISETFVWDIPEEYEEYKIYCERNPSVMIMRTTEKAITTNQYTHICEKEKNDKPRMDNQTKS